MNNYAEKTDRADMNNGSAEEVIYFSDIWRGFIRFWWLCLITTLAAALLGFAVMKLALPPEYTASATFTVQTQTAGTVGSLTDYSFDYNRSTADLLSQTFPYILQSNLLQDAICDDLGLERLKNTTMTASSVTGTNMFTLTAVGHDPQLTYDVLISAIENYPSIAEYVVGNTELHMMTPAQLPDEPSNNDSVLKITAVSALLGFALGLAWIVAYAAIRRTVRTGEDIRRKLNSTCLDIIPEVIFKKHQRRIDTSVLLTNPHVGGGFAESIRSLRNSVIRAAKAGEKVIMITSTAPGEGKTTITVNLASALAKNDKRVLVIDTDLRNQSVNRALKLPEPQADGDGTATVVTEAEKAGFTVINFAPDENGIWKLVSGGLLKKYIDSYRDSYDYILIDTPPCGLTSDPIAVAQMADAALIIIKQDTVRLTRIQSAVDSLLATDVRMLGCVLNGASSGVAGYGSNYGYGKYGGYGRYGKYGYGYGSEKKK